MAGDCMIATRHGACVPLIAVYDKHGILKEILLEVKEVPKGNDI